MKKLYTLLTFLLLSATMGYSQDNELIGTWRSSSGTVEFKGDKTGVMKLDNKNASAPCPEGSVTKFNWQATDNGKLSLTYTSMSICGEKQETPDADAPKPYEIERNTLNWAGVSWER